jgi:predicted metal-dependent hydrolase
MFDHPDWHKQFDKALNEFDRGQFFECHETLETIWRQTDGDFKILLQGMIQIAAGFHHVQGKNRKGARRLLDKGLQKLNSLDLKWFEEELWINLIAFRSEVLEYQKHLNDRDPPFPKIK